MDAAGAKRLRKLARELGKTESEVLREGIELVERIQARKRNIEALIAMIPPEHVNNPPKPIKFRLR